MKILVTGHRGFVGTLLMKQLDAVGIDLKEGKNLLTCDLPDADVIYHLAAQSSVEASWHDPVHDADNLNMTVRLAHNYPKAKIIYASSAAAQPPIRSPYGFSKWAGAEYLKTFHKNSVICIFPNVYGNGSRSVVDIFKGEEEVTIYGDGKQIRDYVHVEDIVRGLLMAQHWDAGEYFMGSEVSTSVLELAEGKTVHFAPPRKEAKESIVPNTTPNWKPKISVKQYLND
jgi:UDP-glucose 4-epimerase